MGKLVVTEFVSLDGVMEAPGGEDFKYPGWSFAFDRGEELLVDVGAHEPDPLVGGDLLGLREGTLDPVGDEREYRVRARWRPVGDDEARDLAQRTLATPCLDRVVVAPAAHDHGARFLDQVAVHPLEHRRIVERPVMEPHPVLA